MNKFSTLSIAVSILCLAEFGIVFANENTALEITPTEVPTIESSIAPSAIEIPVIPETAPATIEAPVMPESAPAAIEAPVMPETAPATIEAPVMPEAAPAAIEAPVIPEAAPAAIESPVTTPAADVPSIDTSASKKQQTPAPVPAPAPAPKQQRQAAMPAKKGGKVCGVKPHPYRAGVRHIESNGIGYRRGYTTLEFFFSSPYTNNYLPFLDIRGHVFNDGRFAFNAGVGYRHLMRNRIWGGYVNYDWRSTHRRDYNQISLGIENLGRTWDFRVNGYIPVGDTNSPWYHLKFKKFVGSTMIIQRTRQFDMYGWHAEAAGHFMVDGVELYPALGPYYFANEGKTAIGAQFRLLFNYKDYLNIEGTVSYDSLFKDTYQCQISVNIPFGVRTEVKRCGPCPPTTCCDLMVLRKRLIQPVRREEIIVIDKKHDRIAAVDPSSGLPMSLVFMSNLGIDPPGAPGSFENPYTTLSAACDNSSPGDIIYVYPGDGTTRGMDSGNYQLLDNQQMMGAGTVQSVETTWGTVNIPPQANGMPCVTAPATGVQATASVFHLANNNTICGMNIVVDGTGAGMGALPYAIGTPLNTSTIALGSSIGAVQNAAISSNVIQATTNAMGVAADVGGNMTITDNNFIGDPPVIPSGSIGVYLPQTRPMGVLMIQNNRFSGFGNNLASTPATPVFGSAINIAPQSGANVTNTIMGNTIVNCDSGASISTYDTSIAANSFSNNVFSGVGTTGLEFISNAASSQSLTLTGNMLINSANALSITANDSSSMDGIIENNQITGCVAFTKPIMGIAMLNRSGGAFTVQGNVLEGNFTASQVFGYIVAETASGGASFVGNSMTNCRISTVVPGQFYGWMVAVAGGGANVTFTGNNSANAFPDLFATVPANGSVCADSSFNDIFSSFVANGPDASATSLCLTYQGNTNQSTNGYQFHQLGSSIFDLTPLQGNTPTTPSSQMGTITPVPICN